MEGALIIPDACVEDINKYYDLSGKALGKGTYGEVYLGVLKNTSVKRAIKVISKESNKNLDRIRSEVEIMRKLDHPNILRLYEAFEDKKFIYLVIEICAGGELFDRIIEKDYFGEVQGRQIFGQIIKSIIYCHIHKVCHRDLKPENFLFMAKTDEKCLKLIDFGLSKNFFHLQGNEQADPNSAINEPRGRRSRRQPPKTNMKTRAGTPFYIAPEVLTGNYLEKCDVWSAGVILYILLCGYPPFYGETNKEILASVKQGELDFSGEEWQDKTNKVFSLLKSMITKESERMDATQVLKHPWMLEEAAANKISKDSMVKIFKLMTQYSKLSKFAQLALVSIARQLNEKEVMPIQQVFFYMNRGNDGEISLPEFFQVGHEAGIAKDSLLKTFTSMDFLRIEKLKYSQILASCIHTKGTVKDAYIKVVFRIWDMDGDGKLSLEDLTGIMNKLYPATETKPSLMKTQFGRDLKQEFASFGTQYIDYSKFEAILGLN